MKNKILMINQRMARCLNNKQLEILNSVLEEVFSEDKCLYKKTNDDYFKLFISSKKVEGCSQRTLKYYTDTISAFFKSIDKEIEIIETNDIRSFLTCYEKNGNSSKITIDNIRRILSSFFSWLEDENYIIKSPVRRIHKIKSCRGVKEPFTDDELETIRSACSNKRDIAILELLISTGIRIGELVNIKKYDMDFINRECIVLGKGNKKRKVYFNARTKARLQEYLEVRNDTNDDLFVSLKKPFNKLNIRGVEIMLSKLGKKCSIHKVHPHRFRRTLATSAIDKGMPIEQVQVLLGHAQIDTTLGYAMVNQNNVKNSYKKHIG